MNKLRRYWNQNKRKIIIIIAIIAFILILIQVVNQLLGQQRRTSQIEREEGRNEPIQSIISGEKVPVEITKENNNIIKQFIDYCNQKDIQNAYQLLSEYCKLEFNNDINVFREDYYNSIFHKKRTYGIELWLHEENSYTYQIKYYEDNLLETGGNATGGNIEDYITIVRQNNEAKININKFIRKQTIQKTKENNDIVITIENRKIYKNYEQYHIRIRNNTTHILTLSDGSNNRDITLLDNNEAAYPSFLNELSMYALTIQPGREQSIDMRFNKIYDVGRRIKTVQFNNIRFDTPEQQKVSITIDI